MAMAIPIAMAAMAAMSALSAASAQRKQQESAADIATYNANLGRQRADIINTQTNQREEQQRRQSRMQLGQLSAQLGETGLDMAGGSGLDVFQQSATNAEMDALTIRYEGQLGAKGALDQAAGDDFQAKVAKMNAQTATRQGYLNAASSALSAFGKGYGMGAKPGATA